MATIDPSTTSDIWSSPRLKERPTACALIVLQDRYYILVASCRRNAHRDRKCTKHHTGGIGTYLASIIPYSTAVVSPFSKLIIRAARRLAIQRRTSSGR